ncbi:CDK-activating kinase assembly factor MAT1-domain-containing protein [Coniella lustricola]|uniref:RNA polymerase II transcription factor B subunit 3 n=1 Tax=Coniella lustricola TaxID=2025994 RepID=A0A2T3A9T4_9PEZI|nr:CDK-activating kinase assembly factor MAT1-domain-containing protein [Coniella lustricola]
MSRPSTSRSGGGPTAAPVTTMTNADGEEQCPICKTLRYMNRNLVFLINQECYHPLCNNCVDRLFENGPNQCPYIGCHKTLRKKGFREPMFSDLNVEREVDIRKRVAAVFNKGEEDFEDLKAYNDYLDMVETLTMDLVYGTDKEREGANQKLSAWEYEHRLEIEKNRKHGERLREQTRKQFAAEKKAATQRRQEAQRQEEEERQQKALQREADLDMLASAPSGAASKIMLKKRGQHRKEALAESEAAAMRAAASTAAGGGFNIKGLKKKALVAASVADETGPYDPFGRLDLRPTRYSLKPRYTHKFADAQRDRPEAMAGGLDFREFYSRSFFEAFAGLSVFVNDEKETGRPGIDSRSVATLGATMAANGDNDNMSRTPSTVSIKRSYSQTRDDSLNGNGKGKPSSTRSAMGGDFGSDMQMTDYTSAYESSAQPEQQQRIKPDPVTSPVVKMEVDSV